LLISLAEHLAHAEIEFQSSVDTFNGSRGIISNGKMTWRAGNLNSKVVLNGIRERQARTHTAHTHTQMSERPRRVERVGVAGLSDLLASSSRLRRRSQRKFIRADNLTSTARNNFSNPARSVSVSRAAHTAAPREFVHTKNRSRAADASALLLDVCKIYPPTDCECISARSTATYAATVKVRLHLFNL
jgi:hypothetical protein